MTTPILLTGGTGVLGGHVLPVLRASGTPVRLLSRREHAPVDGVEFVRGDLGTGDGIGSAVHGCRTILHLAGGMSGDAAKAENLVRAAAAAATGHLVFISVVGADAIPVRSRLDREVFGYYAEQAAAERVIAAGGVPWTTLRATQFHDLVWQLVRGLARLPIVPVPGFRMQPVDTGEVARRLVDLAHGEPAGRVPDLGGPHAYPLAELCRSYLRATGRRRPLVPLPIPGAAARAYRDGANLAPEHADGVRTWEEFLAERVP